MSDHGRQVDILGIGYEVVFAQAHAEARGLLPNESGGYAASVTGAGPFLIVGSSGDDFLISHESSDILCGLSGDDDLNGKGGDDLLIGGPGFDSLKATTGINVLLGDLDDSEITGGSGLDWCTESPNTFSTCENRLEFDGTGLTSGGLELCRVNLRSGQVIVESIECDNGAALAASGDLAVGWNAILSAWEVSGPVRVQAIWEDWTDGTNVPNGVVEWTTSGEHSAGDLPNDKYQELRIQIGDGGRLTIWENPDQTGASVTFTVS